MAATQPEATSSDGSVVPPGQEKTTQSDPDPNSRPKTQLFSLNPLNVPVHLLNLRKQTAVNLGSRPTHSASAKEMPTVPRQNTTH